MTSPSSAASPPSQQPALLSAQWHTGHAVATPSCCCTAYRRRYVVYAATPNAVAVVDVTENNTSVSSTSAIEARWRNQMRVFSLAGAGEMIAFVCGHPERDVFCVGTKQHGLYVTSLSQPTFAAATKLPRTVTGDTTYSATFLFTEDANYLAFSSLLYSRPTDPTPYRLSLWCLDTQALLWRGAMAPLTSMCSFAYDLSFAACQGGKVCLFTVQQTNNNNSSGSTNGGSAGVSPSASAGDEGNIRGKSNQERSRLVVLSRHCSVVEDIQDAFYTCCIASPAGGEDTYLALTVNGFLVAFHATSGSVTRWMDCKVPAATGLSLYGEESLVLTGELTRFFQVSNWEFQGKIKLELPSGLVAEKHHRREGEEESSAAVDAFTSAVTADSNTLLLFYRSGAMSFHTVEPKTGTYRFSLRRTSYYPNVLSLMRGNGNNNTGTSSNSINTGDPVSGKLVTSTGGEPQWLVVSSALWCWWTPHSLVFVSAATGALVAAYAVSTSCATLHPASGVIIVYDTERRALVAYGRTTTFPIAEVGALSCANAEGGRSEGSVGEGGPGEHEEIITSLASSATGESFYALVKLGKSALPPRLRRYRCGWGTMRKGEGSQKSFYIDCMKFPDSVGNKANVVAASSNRNASGGGSNDAAGLATSVSLPAGTHSVLVHTGSQTATAHIAEAQSPSSYSPLTTVGVDRVVAIQRNAVVSVCLSSHRASATAPTYTHPDAIQRVLLCRGGLLVVGAAHCAFVQWKDSSPFHWVAKPLVLPISGGTTSGDASPFSSSMRVNVTAAAVANRRLDIVAVCVDGAVTLWQLSDAPRLLSGGVGMCAAVAAMVIDVEESTRRIQLWTLGSAGVDAYQLGPLELCAETSLLSPVEGAQTGAALTPPMTPVKEPDLQEQQKPKKLTPGKMGRPVVSASLTPRTTAAVAAMTAAGSPLPLPSRVTPPPPAAVASTARQVARTPRNASNITNTATTASTSSSHTTALSEARRQRRTASARAPSSRQLSERFDELTGFYARQKQESQGNEHPRTPRTGGTTAPSASTSTGTTRHVQRSQQMGVDGAETAATTRSPDKDRCSVQPTQVSTPRFQAEEEEGGNAVATSPRPSTPLQPPASRHTTVPVLPASEVVAPGGISASTVDVSALTVDSQMLRSAVTAAAAAAAVNRGGTSSTLHTAERGPTSSPLPWSDSPPQRGDPHMNSAAAAQRKDDAVLRSSSSTFATSPDRVPLQQHPKQSATPPQVQLRTGDEGLKQRQQQQLQEQSAEVNDSSGFASENFTVQARHLRESLLHLKDLLDQSKMTESNGDVSLAPSDEADLDELASLLTAVAAQLHQRQVRRSAEGD